jgi:phytoene dehydrogenase-like protein
MRVAVIGSGVSGIGAAKVLKQCGYDVTVYERSEWIGGVWCVGYPDLHLQVPFSICLILSASRAMLHNIATVITLGLSLPVGTPQAKKCCNI